MEILIHPEMRAIDALRLARSLGCVLVWRGTHFHLRRREGRKPARGFASWRGRRPSE